MKDMITGPHDNHCPDCDRTVSRFNLERNEGRCGWCALELKYGPIAPVERAKETWACRKCRKRVWSRDDEVSVKAHGMCRECHQSRTVPENGVVETSDGPVTTDGFRAVPKFRWRGWRDTQPKRSPVTIRRLS